MVVMALSPPGSRESPMWARHVVGIGGKWSGQRQVSCRVSGGPGCEASPMRVPVWWLWFCCSRGVSLMVGAGVVSLRVVWCVGTCGAVGEARPWHPPGLLIPGSEGKDVGPVGSVMG